MEKIETEIPGLYILKPRIFTDSRGYFFESYNKKHFDEEIYPDSFVQDNESASVKGVIRGLHFQCPPHSQAKLVRCVHGKVLDIAVDIRKSSPTYGKHVAAELSDENHLQFYIPKGFAHGFAVLSDFAIFQYKCDDYYHPECEGGIDMFDEDLAINWLIEKKDAIMSPKDLRHPSFAEFISPFE